MLRVHVHNPEDKHFTVVRLHVAWWRNWLSVFGLAIMGLNFPRGTAA